MNSKSEVTSESLVRKYAFVVVTHCNMCREPASKTRLLGLRLDRSQGLRPRRRSGIAVGVRRCVQCGLIFASPQPIPNSISDHYGVPPEEYWNNVSFEVPSGYFNRQVVAARELLTDSPKIRALDIGLGLGKAAKVMQQAGFDVYGIEPSEPFYRKTLELLGGDSDRYRLGSIEETDFPEGSFDFITFGAVLEHIYDPDSALKKALHWLRPGGILHAEVPNSNHLISLLINVYYKFAGTTFVTNTSPMHTPYHLYEFALTSFQLNGRRSGYEVAKHWIDVGSIFHFPRFLHPMMRYWMSRTGTGMQLTVFLKKVR